MLTTDDDDGRRRHTTDGKRMPGYKLTYELQAQVSLKRCTSLFYFSEKQWLSQWECFYFSSLEPLGSWVSLLYRQAPSSVRLLSIVHTLWTSSPQKPLGQAKLNFIWSFSGIEERTFVQMILMAWPKQSPCPYMVKPFKHLLRNQWVDDCETWYTAFTSWDLGPYKVCSNDDPRLTLIYFIARPTSLLTAFPWENV